MESTDSVRRKRSEFQVPWVNSVTQVVDDVQKKVQLLSLSLVLALCNSERTLHTCSIYYCGTFAKYEHIVELNEAEFQFNADQGHVHGTLENAWCAA